MSPADSPILGMLRADASGGVARLTRRFDGDAHEARHTMMLTLRAELLGVTLDPELDHRQWLAEHRALALPYLERFWAQALTAPAVLAVRAYPPELRDDTALAIANVLDSEPAELTPHTPLYERVADQSELPVTAPHLIGLTGKPRTGKDVVADYLVAHYRGVVRFAFSDAIVDEANVFLARFGHRIVEGNKSLPYYRHLLQAYGMGRRAEDEHYWTKQVKAKLRTAFADGARMAIVTGARMPTDVEVIEGERGEMWRVIRPGNDYSFVGGASAAIESGLDSVPAETFREILNPVEGDLAPYVANIEAALRTPRETVTVAAMLGVSASDIARVSG